MKRLLMLVIILSIPVVLALAQSSELSVEESYLQESVENMIIREQSRAESREMKLIALLYIGDAIDRGNRSEEVRRALEYMGLEGTLNRTRENGRLLNNFPDIRRESVRYLGLMGTEDAKDTLLRIIYYDNEPMVLQEAVKSLGDIGINDNGRTINAIAWVFQKFDNTVPDNLLALAAIEAIEKIGVNSESIDANGVMILIRIAEGNYIRIVQDRAKQALINIRKIQAKQQQEQQQQQQRQ